MNVWIVETTTKGEDNKRLGLASKLEGVALKKVSTRLVDRYARQTGMSLLSIVDKAQHRRTVRPFVEQLIETYEPPDVVISSGSKASSLMIPVSAKLFTDSFWVNIGMPRRFHDLADLILQQAWEPVPLTSDSNNIFSLNGIPHHITPTSLTTQRSATAHHFERYGGRKKTLILLGGALSGAAKTDFYDHHLLAQLRALTLTLSKSDHTIFIANSRRTSKTFWRTLQAKIGDHQIQWIDHDAPGTLTYLSLLANADAIVVCADSMSMLWEASATDKPVFALVPWLERGSTPQPQARNLDILLRQGRVSHLTKITDAEAMTGKDPIDLSAEYALVTLERVNCWRSKRRSTQSFAKEPKSHLIF